MNNDIAISVKNVSKTFKIPHEKISSLRGAAVSIFSKKRGYEEFKALDDVSFEVKKGEFFGIIGRNGSGKSTLLKILAGIYQTDKGSVEIDGRISPFLELGIGFNPELSGRDNVYLNATVLGLTKKEIDKKFDSIVKFSELERFIDQKLKNYSSGMQVRLAFSVSIHANREILLMDEVLAVGDSNFQSKCLEEFNKYRDAGRTVIIVTHDISVVQRYCDRAMLLRNGKIMKMGKAEDVANAYVYDNMSDEEKRFTDEERQKIIDAEKNLENLKGKELEDEKRRIKEEKIKQAEERKNKVVEIMKVELLDKDGIDKNVFETGESLDIKINFEVYKEIENLNFGIGLHAISGGQVFGYNTQMDEIIVDKNKKSITLHFDKLPILKGEYTMNIACWNDIVQDPYDLKMGYRIVRMFSKGLKNNYGGFCDIEHAWKN
ncbi:MAG: ABC transporter related protein [Candidatus Moranbacteria bacterium GW2011_GWE1_35_17]|nr:MAG: ABC transporter related protein [Candidatus Moranbacteria bacterium GW2011_GWE1_35_17]KKP89557.1 MAG: ABC transporter related protein [Parcubacteria group bacterium GW2011_GWC1_36_108]HCU01674.1 ABC transporter ATP-binding protein [Candidatus Nomurabacteria bacterium]